MKQITTYIALGSNMHDPVLQVKQAISELHQLPYSTFVAQSSLYTTKPVGFCDQPDFTNAVVCLETQLLPDDLLLHLQHIEDQHDRVREKRFGPRTLDLDLLLYGDQKINTPDLTVPHYAMYERDFVLTPLYEIAPDLVLPNRKALKDYIKSKKITKKTQVRKYSVLTVPGSHTANQTCY